MPTFAARDLANTFTQTQTVPALTSAGALPISAGGTNQNITLTPSGTGYTVINGGGDAYRTNLWSSHLFTARFSDFSGMAASVGGAVNFRGKYNVAGDFTEFGAIAAHKDNATSGEYGGGLAFYTRENGVGPWTAKSSARMFIDSLGKVGINEVAPDYKLDVNGSLGFTPGASVTPVDNGDVVIEATNNTTLTFKLKGSDGTVRSGTLTLA